MGDLPKLQCQYGRSCAYARTAQARPGRMLIIVDTGVSVYDTAALYVLVSHMIFFFRVAMHGWVPMGSNTCRRVGLVGAHN